MSMLSCNLIINMFYDRKKEGERYLFFSLEERKRNRFLIED